MDPSVIHDGIVHWRYQEINVTSPSVPTERNHYNTLRTWHSTLIHVYYINFTLENFVCLLFTHFLRTLYVYCSLISWVHLYVYCSINTWERLYVYSSLYTWERLYVYCSLNIYLYMFIVHSLLGQAYMFIVLSILGNVYICVLRNFAHSSRDWNVPLNWVTMNILELIILPVKKL